MIGSVGVAEAAMPSPEAFTFGRLITWIVEQQRAFHRELTLGLRSLTAGGGAEAGWGLILASFLYGIFHAAGPGHGKAILAAYLLTHKERAAKGARLAAAAAFCQGLTAIVLVYGLIGLAGWLPRETSTATAWSERLSYALVFLVGAILAARAAAGLASELKPSPVPHLRPQAATATSPHITGRNHGHHDAKHHGCEHDFGCGHAHGPSPAQIERAKDIRTTLGLIFSIGLRPCSGAVLVLAFAYAVNLAWAGVAAVAAMSAGTALAIASLAFLAVNVRRWAASIAGGGRSRYRAVAGVIALAGGVLVMAIGISLITASFAPSHPLGLS
ncbi:MAG: high frequency lysogenization protein HflD [Rhodospirillales bacterium]|nr:high frequency lysogenization protein HflD [Rhodospirillales bacterium]